MILSNSWTVFSRFLDNPSYTIVNNCLSNIAYFIGQICLKIFSACYKATIGKHVFTISFLENYKLFLKEQLLILQNSSSNELIFKAQKLIEANSFNQNRTAYKEFTQCLRTQLYETNKPDEEGFLNRFCFNLYLQNLDMTYDGLINKELMSSEVWSKLKTQPQELIGFLNKSHRQIAESWLHKGQINNIYYDPRLEGDLPSKIFSLNFNGHGTSVIRTPNVTRDVFNLEKTTSEIVPEFLSFLKNGHKHLYINLMITQADCSEKRRSDMIHSLEYVYSNLTVVSLDKDSHFYKQIGPVFADLDLAALFKQIFVENIEKGLNFRFPIQFNIREKIKPLLDQVHIQYFQNQEKLSKEQRRTFIELSYCAIIQELCRYYQPDVMNVSCKSTVDRGAAQLALLYAYHYHSQQEFNPQLVARLVLGPSLAYQNRAMLKDRFKMLTWALEKLL